jgi:hypothetical protein
MRKGTSDVLALFTPVGEVFAQEICWLAISWGIDVSLT